MITFLFRGKAPDTIQPGVDENDERSETLSDTPGIGIKKHPHPIGVTQSALSSIAQCLVASLLFISISTKSQAEDAFTPIEKELGIGDTSTSSKTIKRIYSSAWLNKDTNFAKVFLAPDGPRMLLEWIGARAAGYKLSKVKDYKEEDYAGVTAMIRPIEGKFTAQIAVYVPHPRSEEAHKLGVLSTFSRLEPPAFIADETSELDVNGKIGKVYMKKEEISVLFKLSKGSVVNISTPRKNGLLSLQRYIRMLDLGRLDSKLKS